MKFKQIRSKIINISFLINATLKTRLFSGSGMKILFSQKKEWEPEIIKGFKLTQHQIAFSDFSTENLTDYDLVVPLTIKDLELLSERPQFLEKNPLPIPSKECVKLCDDKYTFNQTMISHGYSDMIPQMGGSLSFPYILKKRIDDWGKNCFIIANQAEEQNFSDRINHPDYFCQKLISGNQEYATHILIRNKKILNSLNIVYRFKHEFPIKGKEKELYANICHCPYLESFTEILNKIGFEGLCCVNYKVVDNLPQIIEINPRFGGSLSIFFFSFLNNLRDNTSDQ